MGSRAEPLPFGEPAEIRFDATDHWELTVVGVTPDATTLLLAHYRGNVSPDGGKQYFVATVRAKYLGPGSASFAAGYRLRAVGDGGAAYTTFGRDDSCGVVPNGFQQRELFTGAEEEGAVCWTITSTDADFLVMIVEQDRASDGRAWLALR